MQVTDEMVRVAMAAYNSDCHGVYCQGPAMRQALTAALAAMWQPIETAPKDGTLIRLWRPVSETGRWQQEVVGCWYVFDDDSEATDGAWIWPDRTLPEIDLVSREWIANDDYYEDATHFTHWAELLPAPSQLSKRDDAERDSIQEA